MGSDWLRWATTRPHPGAGRADRRHLETHAQKGSCGDRYFSIPAAGQPGKRSRCPGCQPLRIISPAAGELEPTLNPGSDTRGIVKSSRPVPRLVIQLNISELKKMPCQNSITQLHLRSHPLKRITFAVKCSMLLCPLSPAQKLDIYLPDFENGPFPVILSIHGGAFMGGDKGDIQVTPMLDGLNQATGCLHQLPHER